MQLLLLFHSSRPPAHSIEQRVAIHHTLLTTLAVLHVTAWLTLLLPPLAWGETGYDYEGVTEGYGGTAYKCQRPGDRKCFPLACPPGQGRRIPSEPCSLCPYGFYNPGGVYGPCLRCPPNTVTISMGATECGCRPGYGTPTLDNVGCRACPNGTYAPGGSLDPCIRCPGSAFMVTPPYATRVSQCTCKPGFGSTASTPTTCQMCPPGTYANALAQIIDIPGVPPQGGKGITRGLIGATVLPCTPCCPSGVGTCSYTTLKPAATTFNDCVLVPPVAPPPPANTSCCGGVACTYPVPTPPSTLPANAAARDADTVLSILSQYEGARVTPRDHLPGVSPAPAPWGGSSSGSGSSWGGGSDTWGGSSGSSSQGSPWWDSSPGSHSSGSTGPSVLTACTANPRVAVSDYQTGIAGNTPWVLSYYADKTAGTSCVWTPTNQLLSACTGNQIGPYLVLTAAHCVEVGAFQAQYANCRGLQLVKVVLCYGYNRAPGQTTYECNTQNAGVTAINAVGASWFPHPTTTSPNDQAIIFAETSRPGPYYQYQYMENIGNADTATTYTYQAYSYVGDGQKADATAGTAGACGCAACPSMPCGLSQTGPANGPLTTDTLNPNNGAVNANLESCGGASGSCMAINGQTCCIGVSSYEIIPSGQTDQCASACTNYWSTISVKKPLSALWSNVLYSLPR